MPTKVDATCLVDRPEDYAVEEKGWVPVAWAPDEDAAIRKLDGEFPAADFGPEFRYVVTGRSLQRPDDAVQTDYGWFVFDAEGYDEHEGRKGYSLEFLTWRPCEPDAEGAVEFWDLELIEDLGSEAA